MAILDSMRFMTWLSSVPAFAMMFLFAGTFLNKQLERTAARYHRTSASRPLRRVRHAAMG
jgi:hypothetical protein